MNEKLKSIFGESWATTVFGFVAGVATYFAALGPNLPATKEGWTSAIVAASLVALGYKAK